MLTRAKLRQDFANVESLQDPKQMDAWCKTLSTNIRSETTFTYYLQSHYTSQYVRDMQEEGGSEEAGLM